MSLEDEVLKSSIATLCLSKGTDYKEQIENQLKSYSFLYNTKYPLQKFSYTIYKEYRNIVIAKLSETGEIKVNN